MSRAFEIVIDAAEHRAAAQAGRAGDDLIAVQPQRALDAAIKAAGPDGDGSPRRNTPPAESCVVSRPVPTDKRRSALRGGRSGGFFQRLADHGVEELLAALGVTRRLVEHHAIADPLLDEQEMAVTRSTTAATVKSGRTVIMAV